MSRQHKLPKTHVCPECGKLLDGATGAGHNRRPVPGDLSVCVQCAAFLEYKRNNTFEKVNEALFNSLPKETKLELMVVKAAVVAMKNPGLGHDYAAQIGVLAARAMQWRKANPDRQALVQFNYPRSVMMIAPISTALKDKIVSTNEAGLELIKALGAWGEKLEPTVMMVRLALENPPKDGGDTSSR
jgi:hypothetical protein